MPKASRAAFGEAILELAETYPNLVVVDADLSHSTMTRKFSEKYPARHFNVGIAESNMVGIGAGLALAGKIPFICSFACFVVNRFEQVRMSVAYNEAPVRIVGTHVGIGIGEDGYSQMGLEDIALIRTLPNIPIIQPADEIETKQAVAFLVNQNRPAYLRLTRQNLDDVNPPSYQFQFGKGVVLHEGRDVALLATGGVVGNALKAAKELANAGVSAAVINIHTIKPLDDELILDAAATCKQVVTIEDHSVNGGLGGAVAELLSERRPTKMKRIGMNTFGESGSPEALYQKYGFSAAGIKKSVLEFVQAHS
jgi:transketolase